MHAGLAAPGDFCLWRVEGGREHNCFCYTGLAHNVHPSGFNLLCDTVAEVVQMSGNENLFNSCIATLIQNIDVITISSGNVGIKDYLLSLFPEYNLSFLPSVVKNAMGSQSEFQGHFMVIKPFHYDYKDTDGRDQRFIMPGVFLQKEYYQKSNQRTHENRLRATLKILGYTLHNDELLQVHNRSILAHVIRELVPVDAVLYGNLHPEGTAVQVSSERGSILMGGDTLYYGSLPNGKTFFLMSNLSNLLFTTNRSRLTEEQIEIGSRVGNWMRSVDPTQNNSMFGTQEQESTDGYVSSLRSTVVNTRALLELLNEFLDEPIKLLPLDEMDIFANKSSAIGASPMVRNQSSSSSSSSSFSSASSSSSSSSSSSKRSGGQSRQNRPSRSFGARVVSMADLGRRSHQHLGGAVERRRRRGSAAALDAALDDDDDDDYAPEINGGSGTTGSAAGGGSMYLEDDGAVTPSEDDANDSDYLAAVPRRPVYRDTSEESDVTSEDDDEVN